MGKSELQTSAAAWTARAQKYQQAGIPENVWQPIALHDMNNTYHLGSTPMTNQIADVAVYSAWKGTPAVAQQPAHHGLADFLNPLHDLGVVTHDIGGIITGLPRGVAHLAGELVTPSTYSTAGRELAQAVSDVGHPGQALRDLQSSSLLDLIPGVDVAAKLTTPEGRQSLEEHPVSALLDVLPVTKPLSAASGAAMAERVGAETSDALTEALSKATTRQKLRGVDVRSQDPSAVAALAAGRPVQALARGVDRALLDQLTQHLPAGKTPEFVARAQEAGLGVGQRAARQAMARAGLDAMGKAASAVLHQGQLETVSEAHDFQAGELPALFKELGSTDKQGRFHPDMAAIEDFTRKATQGLVADMSPGEVAVYDRLMAHRQTKELELVEKGDLVSVPGYGHYAADSPVVQKHKALQRATVKEAKLRAETAAAHEKLLARTAARRDRTVRDAENARSRLVRAVARQHAGLPAPAGALPDWAELGKSLEARHALAVNAREQAKNELAGLVERGPQSVKHDKARKALDDAHRAFDKAIVKEPPAHLQPWILHQLGNKLADAVKAKETLGGTVDDHINTEGVGTLRATGDIHAALKDWEKTPNFDRFKTYLGKDEFQKLLASTVHEALQRQAEGFAPLYIHKIHTSDLDKPAEVSMARIRDAKEDQIQRRLLDGASTTSNMWVAMTREGINSAERRNMQQAWDTGFAPHTKTTEELEPIYQRAQGRLEARGRLKPGRTWQTLMEQEWDKVDFNKYGIRHTSRTAKQGEMWLPKDLAHNLEVAAGVYRSSGVFENPIYRGGMKLFRTSVLYGPRHFAHVVIGGIMPMLLDQPSALIELPGVWRIAHEAARGRPFTGEIGGVPIPKAITAPFDYKVDAATKYMNQAVGAKAGNMLKDFWEKTGAKPGEKLAQWEHAAQTMYQLAIFSKDLRRGVDPVFAAEHARRLVVNLDTMAPFERTIFKQIMPFYSFTRFATRFLAHLPFDHPLRVAVLSRLSNQAEEEWGTGLPQSMMSLFFFGHPKAGGNQWTVNLRNMNPFRSLSNQFTLAGFISSMNPAITAPFQAMGYNPLKGQQLYPEITYDPTTGSLVAAHPRGGAMTAAEAFVPELGAIDAFVGISDNFRTLKMGGDHSAQMRELMNLLNIPFQVSQYNLPNVRARVAKNELKGAQTAMSEFQKTGDYEGTIGRFNLIPYQGRLIPPQAFAQYWQQLQHAYGQQYPGASLRAVLPKSSSTPKVNTLAELLAQGSPQ